MAAIIPRWEWRTFGGGQRAAEDAFAALTPGPVKESEELYLLSAAGGNVKVRDGLLDIKLLREVNADGLERWGRGPQVEERFSLDVGAVPTPSASGSPTRWHPGCWTTPWRPSRPTSPASTATRRRLPWWGWAARSPTSRR
jgi:hypothetical protein